MSNYPKNRKPALSPTKLVAIIRCIQQNMHPKEIAFLVDINPMSVYRIRKRYFLEVYVRNGIPLPPAARKLAGEIISPRLPTYLTKK